MRSINLSSSPLIALGIVVASALCGPLALAADAPPRRIAFSGQLDKDGGPVNNPALKMEFFITAANGDPSTSALWRETIPAVPVSKGRFSVELGAVQALPDALFQNPDLYIGVVVDNIELSGRHHVVSTPYAITAAQAKSFTVTGALAVNGATDLKGGLTVSSGATSTGDLTVGGTATLSGATNAQNLTVSKDLTVDGKVTISGALFLDSWTTKPTQPQVGVHEKLIVGNGMGWGAFGSWRFCSPNMYVCGFNQRVEGNQGEGGDDTAVNDVQLVCCPFGSPEPTP